jgi:hypothetical protein
MRSTATALCAALAALAACGADVEQEVEATELEARASAPSEAPALAIDPARTGTVSGRVAFAGPPPERRSIALLRECQGHGAELLAEDVVVGPQGGLRDVLVHVRRGLAGYAVPPAPAGPAPVLDQAGCRFTPHVLALRAGGSLLIANSDPLTHNVRVRAPRNSLDSNRTLGEGAAPLELSFARAELGVRVACDLHPWMGAVVHALDHPFFALTGADGAFQIAGLPAGEYELEALHPTLGKVRATVAVAAAGAASADFTFGAD